MTDILAQRVQFVEEPPEGRSVLRTFSQPRGVALISDVDLESPSVLIGSDQDLHLVFVAPKALSRWKALAAEKYPAFASPSLSLRKRDARVQWSPGCALVVAPPADWDMFRSSLVPFAFYERELRSLEGELERHAVSAGADVRMAHRVRKEDAAQWPRLGELAERFARLRLDYGQLEARLVRPPKDLSGPARSLFFRLYESSEIEDRLEEASNQLENYEDLYAGANDRISDFRWFRSGSLLEKAIVALLLVEIFIMSCDLAIVAIEHFFPQPEYSGDE